MRKPFDGGFHFSIFLSLIRAVFPRWNFFDRVAHGFEIYMKAPGAAEWVEVSFDQRRTAFSLFLNPSGNLALAQVGLIEHFARDIQVLQIENPSIHSRDVQALTTFRMLVSLLNEKLKDFDFPAATLQFKVVARNPSESIDVYVSDWIPVGNE